MTYFASAVFVGLFLGWALVSGFVKKNPDEIQRACGKAGVASVETSGFWILIDSGLVVVCRDGKVVKP